MYIPKINPEFIPRIYEIAKARGIHMTTLVNEVLGKALDGTEGTENEQSNKDGGDTIREPGKKVKGVGLKGSSLPLTA